MKTTMKMRKKNPYRVSFFAVTVICCVALSVVFYYISYMNNKVTREKYAQEKAKLVMGELETQLQLMEDVALRIVSNYEFQPYFFEVNIARKLSMLETFKQYRYHIALADEYFLDYGGKWIYKSSGGTVEYETFMQTKFGDEVERQRFRESLLALREELTEICGKPKLLSVFEDIYVLIPLRMNDGEQYNVAILGFVVKKSALEERFRIASGGIEGEMALYGEEGILYSNQEKTISAEQKNVVTAVSQNGIYMFCYRPQREYNMQRSLFFLQILLVLFDAFLVFVIANIFAERAYKPIWALAEKYRGKTEKKEHQENALEELKNMMDGMLQSNQEANLQIQKNQKMLRDHILQMIMEGNSSLEVQSYLEKVNVYLPGPFYCVISISFKEEGDVTKKFLYGLQEALEQISDENDREYVYTICSTESKLLNVICSSLTEAGKDELVDIVCDVAESFGYEPIIGVGKAYQALNNLSASWLESMDVIQSKKRIIEEEGDNYFVYNAEELRRISVALESGDESAALERLECYVKNLDKSPVSMLMQQYILADFLGEMRKLGEKYRLEVSKQNISLLVSARSVQDFKSAAKNMIQEFCEGYEGIRSQMKWDEAKRICEYINEHFVEYDISIESVASHFHTSTDIVRQAVLACTGKLYRDYIIYLRIEQAKVLLRQDNIPVAELCEKVGYGNVSYFVRLFREVTGVTPAKYRKNAVDK